MKEMELDELVIRERYDQDGGWGNSQAFIDTRRTDQDIRESND